MTADGLLARVGLTATLVYTVPHAVFHATHLDGFPAADAIVQTVATALHVMLTAGLLALTWSLPPRGRPVPP